MNAKLPSNMVERTGRDQRPAPAIAALIADGSTTPTLRRTLLGISSLVVVLIGWASFTTVDELARARGEIQPGARVQVLQTREGGTITKLHVKEGDVVKPDQLIAEFMATDLQKLQTQTAIKLNALAIDRERMLALLENRKPNFATYEKDYPMLVQQARITYREALASREAALGAKRSEGGQQSALIAGAEADAGLIERQIREARERLRRLEDGAQKGVVTQLALSDARQQVIALEERLADTRARATGMRSTLSGVGSEVAKVRADLNQQLSQELSKVTEQYRELQAESAALLARQGRVEIKSPVDGIVMDLPQTAEGAVLAAGGVVAEVVPSGGEVLMEVMVSPRDIGFVKVGQRASVKIDSFDSARFGAVEGKVQRVAPTSTKLKENGMPFYKVEVALANPWVGSAQHRVGPGMTGEADIATGYKSIMQWLLKPVVLAADTAFHER